MLTASEQIANEFDQELAKPEFKIQRLAYNLGIDHCIKIIELYRKHNTDEAKWYFSELIPDAFFAHVIKTLSEIKQNG